jgi:hypothetical protein
VSRIRPVRAAVLGLRAAGAWLGLVHPRGPVLMSTLVGADRDLYNRVFNAVGRALRDSDEWVPLSVRKRIADAVMAEVLRPGGQRPPR